MPKDLKKGQISFVGDKPMQFMDRADDDAPALTTDQKRTISVIGKVVHSYREAAKSLLSEKYSHLKKYAP